MAISSGNYGPFGPALLNMIPGGQLLGSSPLASQQASMGAILQQMALQQALITPQTGAGALQGLASLFQPASQGQGNPSSAPATPDQYALQAVGGNDGTQTAYLGDTLDPFSGSLG